MIYLLSYEPREEIIHFPVICFNLLEKNVLLECYDMLMFTSKQAVASIDAVNKEWRKKPSIAIGDATAKQIEKLGGTVLYISKKFYVQSLAEMILKHYKHKKILYLRPKEVSFDVKAYLASKNIILYEKILYETLCLTYTQKEKPKKDAILIFTSPSTIVCFLKNFTWDKSYRAVVIGETTKKHLPKNADVYMADKPSIDACIAKAKYLIQS